MIGIIGAMEEEVTILRGDMRDVRIEKIGLFEFYRGNLAGQDVVLLRCGIGKVLASIGCTMMITKFAPRFIVNSGCAGGVNPAGFEPLSFGDAVISSALVYHDFDITPFGYRRGQVPGRKTAQFEIQRELVNQTMAAVIAAHGESKLPAAFKAVPGLIASGDIFVSNSTFVLELAQAFPGIRAVDMESAAIGHTCEVFNVPFVALRCLSDIAGEESPITFDAYLPVAAANSSEIVRRLVAGA